MSTRNPADPIFSREVQVRWKNYGRAWYGTVILALGALSLLYLILPASWLTASDSVQRTATFLTIAFAGVGWGLLVLLSPTAPHSSVGFEEREASMYARATVVGLGLGWVIVSIIDLHAFGAYSQLSVWLEVPFHALGLVPALTLWDKVQRQVIKNWYMFARLFSL
ncbi:hypothetical protein [Arthrobacter sp. ZGTC412]|uniref:hypothetical protein n=1 Tax=Arthrobacter sp. ZGTC412 TaxID=2058900 RepID=UPI000CE2D8E3|nr:hypothetical protein [Arthrobacter sp. ZGTC412]